MKKLLWDSALIKQCEEYGALELVTDSQALVNYQKDFGGIVNSKLAAVVKPQTIQQLIKLFEFAQQHYLPLTLRAYGLSQSGQALAGNGGVVVDVNHFKGINEVNHQSSSLIAECAVSWREIIAKTLPAGYIPKVLPYNLDLSVAGIISAGGLGAASMRYGTIAGNIKSLDVIGPQGNYHCSEHQQADLFDVVRGGIGRFGMIHKAEIKLRPVQPRVRSFYLLYDDYKLWLHDQLVAQRELNCNYLEAFCTPCIQGTRNNGQGREVFPSWFYTLHLSYEFDDIAPDISELSVLNYYKLVHSEDNSIEAYTKRHDIRFQMMKSSGNWQLFHPWYECFISYEAIEKLLPQILNKIPLFMGGIYQLFPLAKHKIPPYLMLPNQQNIMVFCVLAPGITAQQLPIAQQTLRELDSILLAAGGKRYLSGLINHENSSDYWQQHYNTHYETVQNLKKQYDPHEILGSCLSEHIAMTDYVYD